MACDKTTTTPITTTTITTATLVHLSETRLEVHVETMTFAAALDCRTRFSCIDTCSLGYRTGGNGCPTCTCLQPITGNVSRHQLTIQFTGFSIHL